MGTQQDYEAFIAKIDNSQAGTDQYGNLAWHVDCSAQANAGDTVGPYDENPDKFWACALDTAEMILDDWTSYYPQLIKKD